MKQTRDSIDFQLKFSMGSWFLLVTLKNSVILYLWDNFPHYKFMLVKEWKFEEKTLKSHIIPEERSSQYKICIQLESKFILANVTSNYVIDFKLSAKKPSSFLDSGSSEILCGFEDVGYLINRSTFQKIGHAFHWKTKPSSLILQRNYVVNFGVKNNIEIYEKTSGKFITDTTFPNFRKINYLYTQDDVIFFSAKTADSFSSVYALDL